MLLSRNDRLKLRESIEFKRTNSIWNNLRLNHAFIIGYLMTLIKEINPYNFEEWERGYFKSGQSRAVKLQTLTKENREQLLDYKRYSENNLYIKDKKNIKINTHMGRTTSDLLEIAKILQEETKLSIEKCFNFVYIRVIDETWIGREREIKSLGTLKRLYPGYIIQEVSQYIDTKYAIDFEVFKDNILILAIQLKSLKYYEAVKDSPKGIMKEVKDYNQIKNKEYTSINNVPVIYIYTLDGINLFNIEELTLLCSKTVNNN